MATKKKPGMPALSGSEAKRLALVKRHVEGGERAAEMAREAGVSNAHFYAWVKRYKAGEPVFGKPGFARVPKPPQDDAPPRHQNGTPGSYWKKRLEEDALRLAPPTSLAPSTERAEPPKANGTIEVQEALETGVLAEVRRLKAENTRLRNALAALEAALRE